MLELNVENPDLIINIAIAGSLPREEHTKNVILSKINKVLNTTKRHIEKYANSVYEFSENPPMINCLLSPLLADTQLIKELKKNSNINIKYTGIIDGHIENEESAYFDSYSVFEEEQSSIDSKASLIYFWLSDQADFTIVLKDDTNPYLRDFIKHCKHACVPAVIIENSTDRHILWTKNSLYDSYDDGKLETYLDHLIDIKNSLVSVDDNKKLLGRKFLLDNLYDKYVKKFEIKADLKPQTKDTIMDPNIHIASLSENAENKRLSLIKWFNEFDTNAILFAKKYRSIIYLRAVIPLIVTIALAIGFYTETLLSPWPVNIPGTNLQIWSIIAGFAFFTHALLNFYIYRLSENNTIQSWHKSFLDNRFIAEKLRLAVHFIPFGIPVNFAANLNRYGTKGKYNQKIMNRLRCIIKETSLPETDFNKVNLEQCLIYLEELVNSQREYHNKTEQRYAKIFDKLKRYGKAAFYIGFIFILFRGCLQLFFSFFQFNAVINGEKMQPILKSFANMLALFFPAWAAYFSSKLSLCNFEGLYQNDSIMMEELEKLKQMINDEKQKEYPTYGDIYYLAKDVTSLLLGENSEWYAQINTITVKKL